MKTYIVHATFQFDHHEREVRLRNGLDIMLKNNILPPKFKEVEAIIFIALSAASRVEGSSRDTSSWGNIIGSLSNLYSAITSPIHEQQYI